MIEVNGRAEVLTVGKADISNSCFSNSDLLTSKMSNVDLAGTQVTNVDLSDARFTKIDLTDAIFYNAVTDGMTINGVSVTDLFAAHKTAKIVRGSK